MRIESFDPFGNEGIAHPLRSKLAEYVDYAHASALGERYEPPAGKGVFVLRRSGGLMRMNLSDRPDGVAMFTLDRFFAGLSEATDLYFALQAVLQTKGAAAVTFAAGDEARMMWQIACESPYGPYNVTDGIPRPELGARREADRFVDLGLNASLYLKDEDGHSENGRSLLTVLAHPGPLRQFA